jgi:hypothetical protein
MCLESNLPLSNSLIWRRQREFYLQRGLGAWTADKVPQFITNNPLIAEIYANIVFQFVGDCIALDGGASAAISAERPLRILELGAGTGKFGYLFLRQLQLLLLEAGISLKTVRYCMSDCSPSVLESWRANSYLAEFVQAGVLEFQLFEAGEQTRNGRETQAGSSPAPLVLIANYVFDSLPQDVFVIQDGRVYESLVTTTAQTASWSTAAPCGVDKQAAVHSPQPSLSSLQFSWQTVIAPPQRYADAAWNQILEQYRASLPGATVPLPSGVLKALQELAVQSDGRMLVLVADKGHAYEDVLALVQGPPKFEWHAPDCFSLMVNLDAIGKYFTAAGGEALLPDRHFSGLNVCGFLRRRPGDDFPATRKAYRQSQAAVGPDDLFTLLSWLNAHMEEMTIAQILAALKLTRWDPIALIRLFPVLGRQLGKVAPERHDLREAVLKTWANHYPVEPGDNVLAFDCGVILLELRFFSEAMDMFKTSQRALGPSAATSYNLGLCAQGLGNWTDALAWMEEACNLDSKFEPARSARAKLELELKNHQGRS